MTRSVPLLKAKAAKALASKLPRVAVLVSSYKGSAATTAAYDADVCTPAHWVGKDFPYRFTYHEITKLNAHQEVRKLVKETEDPVCCFFNLCDGALEEDRAGIEVVRALEMFNVPFTGPLSEGFEPNKVSMKLLADKAGVRIPPFALVQRGQNTSVRCRHLKFPVIVKPPSGFASVGITKDSKCHNMKELEKQVAALIKDLDVALVEEFITGREGTVLVCRDEKGKDGVHVFPPIDIKFPGGADDFGSFENKWNPTTWGPNSDKILAYDINDPVYPKIIEMARRAYRAILQGNGYGRVDFRIDDKHGTGPYFLEINPNCGMWYPKDSGGDWADIMVQYDKDWDHSTFAKNQIEAALKDATTRKRWWRPTVDATRQFVTKATVTVPAGTKVFGDIRPVPVILKASFTESGSKVVPGCVMIRGDDRSQMVALKHSCKPNLQVVHGCTLEVESSRFIRKGDILTIDYSSLRDPDMPPFDCKCGSEFCRGTIRAQLPRPRKLRPVPISRRSRQLALKNAAVKKGSAPTSAAATPAAEASPATPAKLA